MITKIAKIVYVGQRRVFLYLWKCYGNGTYPPVWLALEEIRSVSMFAIRKQNFNIRIVHVNM